VSVRPPTIVIALTLALAITALWWQLAERRARHEVAGRAAAEARLAALEDSLASTARRPPPVPRSTGGRDEVILADLARHPELIPFPGVEGGTMRFHAPQCRIVAPGWAYGYFEDGHVSGRGVFEYKVGRSGEIRWTRIAAKLD
jgi:hypothetical protein